MPRRLWRSRGTPRPRFLIDVILPEDKKNAGAIRCGNLGWLGRCGSAPKLPAGLQKLTHCSGWLKAPDRVDLTGYQRRIARVRRANRNEGDTVGAVAGLLQHSDKLSPAGPAAYWNADLFAYQILHERRPGSLCLHLARE